MTLLKSFYFHIFYLKWSVARKPFNRSTAKPKVMVTDLLLSGQNPLKADTCYILCFPLFYVTVKTVKSSQQRKPYHSNPAFLKCLS